MNNSRVLFVSGRETEYPRNKQLISLLSKTHTVSVLTGQGPSLLRRTFQSIRSLLSAGGKCEAIYVGFYGYLILPFARLRFPATRIVFDAFLSTYDTLQSDSSKLRQLPRGLSDACCFLHRRTPLILWMGWLIDYIGLHLASEVLIDTQAQKRYLSRTFGIKPEKITVLYLSVDKKLFSPAFTQGAGPSQSPLCPSRRGAAGEGAASGKFTVLYYASFLPLHGVDVILKAAERLKDCADIRFVFFGDGPQRRDTERTVEQNALTNVTFREPVPLEKLPGIIAQADLCLAGHFSDIPKAGRVIAAKTIQMLSMCKPTVITETEANKELVHFAEWPDWEGRCIWVMPHDPAGLAEAIHKAYKTQRQS
ncbi:MAG: glycosyltransferase [Candidatus Omnitrophica bacterium]|nr:glycosyltransferase [Candidatus Omnitrophota bacterium]